MSLYNKLLGSAASKVAKVSWLSKIFKGSSAVLKGAGKFFANPWVSAALLAWELYDMFDDDSDEAKDPAAIVADGGRSRDVIRVMYPSSILRVLTEGVSDSIALSGAFTQTFLRASSSSDSLARLRAPFYACMADYLLQSPDVNVIIYNPANTAALLDELSAVMAHTEDPEAQAQIDALKLSASDIAEAPLDVRRVLDFTAHFVSLFKKELDNE